MTFGIPYADVVDVVRKDDVVYEIRQCPACSTLIPQAIDAQGETVAHDYADHYAEAHTS